MNNTVNVKTIIVDLDRTLLHTDKTLSSYTVEVLKECKNRGMRIVVATARPLRDITQYCDRIDFDALVVSNGARVILGTHRIEYGICQKSAEHLLNTLQRYPELRITLETGECAYSNKSIEEYETVVSDDLVGIVKVEGVLKILVHLDDKETLEIVKNELSEDLYDTISNGYLMQIMNKTATKWNGIKAILDLWNYSVNEAVYFGDDYDDIEPIKRCGIGVAVANGIDEVKDAADYVAECNDADGVAKFMERFFLQSRYSYMDKNQFGNCAKILFDIMADNMAEFSDMESSREEDYHTWFRAVQEGLQKPNRKIIIIRDANGIIGFFQYYTNQNTFMMEEVQIIPKYQGKGVFRGLYQYLLPNLDENIVYVEAYVDKRNDKSKDILNKLGLHVLEVGNERFDKYQGSYHDLLIWCGLAIE